MIFDKGTIVLNMYKGKHKKQVNLFIAVMKQYVYASKCFENIPTFMEFAMRLSMWYKMEKLSLAENYNVKEFKRFMRKWGNIF